MDQYNFICFLYFKERYTVLHEWKHFEQLYEYIISREFEPEGHNPIEGFVVEDASGYMVKIKTDYYDFWKKMRSIVSTVFRQGFVTGDGLIHDQRSIDFYEFLRSKYQKYQEKTSEKMSGWTIIGLRKEFEKLQKGGS